MSRNHPVPLLQATLALVAALGCGAEGPGSLARELAPAQAPEAPTLALTGARTTAGANDFTLSVSGAQTLITGSLNSAVVYTVKAAFTGTVSSVGLSVSGVPPALTTVLFDSTLTTSTDSTTLTLTDLLGTAPAGGAATTFTVTGTAGSLTHSATSSVKIDGRPTLGFGQPANNATVSGAVAVSATAAAGAGSTVQGMTLTLDGNVQLPSSTTGTGTTAATLTATFNSTPFAGGAHTLTVAVTDADGGIASASRQVTIVAPVTNDFSIALSPASRSTTPGGSAQFTVTTAVTSGASETVTLSTQGLPAGLTWNSNPAVLQAGGTSTLTVGAPAGSTAIASTTFSVIGKSASVLAGHGASAAIAVTIPVVPPPVVTLTAPAAGTVSGVVTVSAAAVVAAGLTLQSLTVYDGLAVIANGTSTALSVSWDTWLVTNGSHTLVARATDSSGVAGASAPVSVTVNNTTSASDFAIALSAAQSVARGAQATFTVTTTALGTAPTVKLSVAGLPAGVTGSLTPDSVTAGGASTLTVAAGSAAALGQAGFTVTGAVGTTTRSAPGLLTVTAGPGGGTGGGLAVAITTPNDGATVSGQVLIGALATLVLGTTLTRIEFFVDGAAAGTATTSPGSVTWDATTATQGQHGLTAKVHDSAGNTATSGVVSVSVGAATAPAAGCASPGAGLLSLVGLLTLCRRRKTGRGPLGISEPGLG